MIINIISKGRQKHKILFIVLSLLKIRNMRDTKNKKKASIRARPPMKNIRLLKKNNEPLFLSIAFTNRSRPKTKKNQNTGSFTTSALLSTRTGLKENISVTIPVTAVEKNLFVKKYRGIIVIVPKKSETAFAAKTQSLKTL